MEERTPYKIKEYFLNQQLLEQLLIEWQSTIDICHWLKRDLRIRIQAEYILDCNQDISIKN